MPGKLQSLQGRSRDPFQQYLRLYREELLVPEGDITLVEGVGGWSPEKERVVEGRCPCGGLIRPGSRLYCPACHLSGFEGRLAEQRHISPPPARRRTYAGAKKPKAKKSRRKSA